MTFSVAEGQVVLFRTDGSNIRDTRCTLRPPDAGAQRRITARPFDEDGGGTLVHPWWTGGAELACNAEVTGVVSPSWARWAFGPEPPRELWRP